ncbi:MAG: ABC transporter permease subunit [Chloroflexi bacterium]|nr:ABC transporter permease subunit [Chloroflexota bacterium]
MEENTAPAPGILTLNPPRSRQHENPYAKIVRRFLRNRFALVAVAVMVLVILLSAAAPYLTTSDPVGRDAPNRLLPLRQPTRWALMSWDAMSSRACCMVARSPANWISVGAAVGGDRRSAGADLGHAGGRVDNLIMRFLDLILAFPGLILAIWLVGLLGSSVTNVILAITVFSLPTYARLTRGATLAPECRIRRRGLQHRGNAAAHRDVSHLSEHLRVVDRRGDSQFFRRDCDGRQPEPLGWESGRRRRNGERCWRQAAAICVTRGGFRSSPALWITVVVLALNIVGDGIRDALDPNLTNK